LLAAAWIGAFPLIRSADALEGIVVAAGPAAHTRIYPPSCTASGPYSVTLNPATRMLTVTGVDACIFGSDYYDFDTDCRGGEGEDISCGPGPDRRRVARSHPMRLGGTCRLRFQRRPHSRPLRREEREPLADDELSGSIRGG
jgi:hypothetical protein